MKIFIIGNVATGKTTICKMLSLVTGLTHYSIDEYRHKYGDGYIQGEWLAYEHFVGDVNRADSGIVECTGGSVSQEWGFPALHRDHCPTIRLICHSSTAQYREQSRAKEGHKYPPFPYTFDGEWIDQYNELESLIDNVWDISLEWDTDVNSAEETVSFLTKFWLPKWQKKWEEMNPRKVRDDFFNEKLNK